ncbi:MAG: hypothetical protein M5U28_35990 [Sandaracinaceae bacterium]|nr:hypothetical protein [Sandaracinaceae bacterium]
MDRDLVRSFGDLAEESRTESTVTLLLTEESIDALRELAVNQAQETIKNRIGEMGLQEANVRAQDIDIIVEVPGASESHFQRIREIISQTARLEFQIVDDASTFVTTLNDAPASVRRVGDYLLADSPGACPEGVDPDASEGRCRAHHPRALRRAGARVGPRARRPRLRHRARRRRRRQRVGPGKEEDEAPAWRTYVLYTQPPNGSDPVGGEHLEDAAVANDPQTGEPVVTFAMNAEGARRMQELTSANMQKRMAIVLDGEVESAPVIRAASARAARSRWAASATTTRCSTRRTTS